MSRWKVEEVLREGTLLGKYAGQTTVLRVRFPWGTEEREFAPTMTKEDIRLTLESIVDNRNNPPPVPTATKEELHGMEG